MSDPVAPKTITREIPLPSSVSEVARQNLATMMAMDMTGMAKPVDTASWLAMIEFADNALKYMIAKPAPGTTVEPIKLGDIPAFDVTPHNLSAKKVCLYFHGGGLTMGGGEACAAMTASFAEGAQIRSIGVDYRMPPLHPYPTPLDDCLAAYRALLETHAATDIVVAGVSAGGTLGCALLLRARDEGLPLPAAALMLSPEIDLTESGDSFDTLLGVDPVLRSRLTDSIRLYAGDQDLTDPYVSPLFGDFSKGFPPTFLQCGTRDLFLSNTVRFHRALRRQAIPAELHVFEAMPHGGFGSILEGGLGKAPEDQEVYEELRRFLAARA